MTKGVRSFDEKCPIHQKVSGLLTKSVLCMKINIIIMTGHFSSFQTGHFQSFLSENSSWLFLDLGPDTLSFFQTGHFKSFLSQNSSLLFSVLGPDTFTVKVSPFRTGHFQLF